MQASGSTETLSASRPKATTNKSSLSRGTAIGRYIVLDWIGSGGMGQVYAAFDPDLDRKVALKLVGPRVRARSEAPQRLLREAQAMARIEHPNVVTVHDVGVHRGQVFLAMDLITGGSLRQWIRRGPHPWRRVVEIFLAVGEGLHAAHRAGLVHRDLKPENLLLTDDGGVLIADFGLARSSLIEGEPEATARPEPAIGSGSESLARADATPRARSLVSSPLTRDGSRLGSPAYMAPEQYHHARATALSDQFSFCVTFYEALFGAHPFGQEGREGMQHEEAEPKPITFPPAPKVPRRLRQALRQGLELEPSRRHPSMEHLLRALAPPARAWSRQAIAAALLGVVLSATWAWQLQADRRQEGRRGAAEKMAAVWNEETRDGIRRSVAHSGSPLADETWRQLDPSLVAYANRWQETWAGAWEATHLRGEQSAELHDRRMLCLDRALQGFRALTRRLDQGPPVESKRLLSMLEGLPELAACNRVEALMNAVPPPSLAADRQKLGDLRQRLAEAWVHEELGRYEQGLELANGTLPEVEGLGYEPLKAEALRIVGRLYFEQGALEEAGPQLEQSLWSAMASGHTEEAAYAAADLSELARLEADIDEGVRWLRLADALGHRLDATRLAADLRLRWGDLYSEAGQYDDAASALEEALPLLEEVHGPNSYRAAEALNSLGKLAFARGDYESATGYFSRAESMYEATLGPEHPDVARAASNLGAALRRVGRQEEALEPLHRAITIRRRALGNDHPFLGDALNNLANVRLDLLDNKAAYELFLEAERIYRNAFGGDHPRLATLLLNLGRVSHRLGRREDSGRFLQAALEMTERVRGPDHRDVADMLFDLSLFHLDVGELDLAEREIRRAHEIYTQTLGVGGRKTTYFLGQLARIDSARGQYEEALDYNRRGGELLRGIAPEDDADLASKYMLQARILLEAGCAIESWHHAKEGLRRRLLNTDDPILVVDYRWILAQAQLAAGHDPASALELGREAGRVFHATRNQAQSEAVERWLSSRSGTPELASSRARPSFCSRHATIF